MNELDESRGGDGAGREKIKANKKIERGKKYPRKYLKNKLHNI